MAHDRSNEAEARASRMLRLARVFEDPLRMKVLGECTIRPMSPRSFREGFGGGSLAKIAQAFELLEQDGWLERARHGTGKEPPDEYGRLFGATEPPVVDDDAWAELPDSIKAVVSWRIFEGLTSRVKEAMQAGTISERADSHITWTPLELDRQGWKSMIARVNAVFESLSDEQEAASARMARSGEEPIPVTVALLTFESPRDVT